MIRKSNYFAGAKENDSLVLSRPKPPAQSDFKLFHPLISAFSEILIITLEAIQSTQTKAFLPHFANYLPSDHRLPGPIEKLIKLAMNLLIQKKCIPYNVAIGLTDRELCIRNLVKRSTFVKIAIPLIFFSFE